MDAKVLRAAVAAAIRVTVSTTLIGCGGTVSTDPGRTSSSPAVKDTPMGEVEDTPKGTGGQNGSVAPTPTASAGGRASTPDEPSAGTASGGVIEVGGMASAAGAGGEPASAGAPADVCGNAAFACVTTLEETPPEDPLSDASKACCDTILARLDVVRLDPGAACFDDLDHVFMGSPARSKCCHDPSTWQNPACTPWGPPVPPELSREALLEWSLAA